MKTINSMGKETPGKNTAIFHGFSRSEIEDKKEKYPGKIYSSNLFLLSVLQEHNDINDGLFLSRTSSTKRTIQIQFSTFSVKIQKLFSCLDIALSFLGKFVAIY